MFWNLWNNKPDNFNIFYYVLVYDFYVPEITNLSATWVIIWGHNPVIKWVWAVPNSDLSFYSWYSKDTSLQDTNPKFSSLVAHSPRLNWLPQNMPIFELHETSDLPYVRIYPSSLTHKIRAWANWEFSFKPVAGFPYLEWDNLEAVKKSYQWNTFLTEEEKESYQISAQYLDDKWNLIWAPPKQFKVKSDSPSVLFYHNLNKAGSYETDSPRPIIAGSYLPNKIISARVLYNNNTNTKTVYTKTDDKWDFKVYVDLSESTNPELRIFSGRTKVWTLKIEKVSKRDFPEIITPISWEQFYSRYIPFECNAASGTTVYYKFWVEDLSSMKLNNYWLEKDSDKRLINSGKFKTDEFWKCIWISPFLEYLYENEYGNSVYYLSTSYKSDYSKSDRVSFRMRPPTDPLVITGNGYKTPKILLGTGDDIELWTNSIKFEFSRFRNSWSSLDFSTLSFLSPEDDITISPWVSLFMSAFSMIEIKNESARGVLAILPKWATVVHKKTWIENTVYNPWIYHFNWEYLNFWDIIKAPKSWMLVGFITGDDISIKSYNKIAFIAASKNSPWSTYVSAPRDVKYSFWESDMVIMASCDYVMKNFFENNWNEDLANSLSREGCLKYAQLSIDKDKSPGFIYPRSSYRIKSWEKLRVLWYAWPGSNLKISTKVGQKEYIFWTTTTNKDWYFDFTTALDTPEIASWSGAIAQILYIEDTDQSYALKKSIVIYFVPENDRNIDIFNENLIPKNRSSNWFNKFVDIINTSIFNRKN